MIRKGDFALVDTVNGEEIVQVIGVFNSEIDELFFSKSGRKIIVKKFVIAIQPVGTQGGIYQGGLTNKQIFVSEPWNIDGVKIIGQTPIK